MNTSENIELMNISINKPFPSRVAFIAEFPWEKVKSAKAKKNVRILKLLPMSKFDERLD